MANEQVKYQQAHENVLLARRRLARLEERILKPGPDETPSHSGTRTPTVEEKQQIEDAKDKLEAAEKAELKAQLALHRSLTQADTREVERHVRRGLPPTSDLR